MNLLAEDNIRLEKNKKRSNILFETQILPILKKEFYFDDFINFEYATRDIQKKFDQDLKIDYICFIDETPIALQARTGSFAGFTIRKTSRNSKTEFYTTLQNLSKEDFPVDKDSVFSIQGQFHNSALKRLWICGTEDLYVLCSKLVNENIIQEKTASQDGNKFYYLPYELIKNYIQVKEIDIK